jgi:hypothetical protein
VTWVGLPGRKVVDNARRHTPYSSSLGLSREEEILNNLGVGSENG